MVNTGVKILRAAIVLVGLGGILGQLVLLREMLVTFYGNELTMGVILANWLAAEAAGAYFGGKKLATDGKTSPRFLFIGLLFLYAAILPAAIYYTRGFTLAFWGLLPGETIGPLYIFISTILLIGPVSVVHGALFPLGCSILSDYRQVKSVIGKVYIYETLGTLAGGVFFTLLLASRFHSLEITLALAFLHLLVCIFLLGNFLNKSIVRLILQMLTLAAAVILLAGFTGFSTLLHLQSLQRQWVVQEVIHYENTPYGNIVVTRYLDEHNFFYDGRLLITLPVPDRALIADYVHIAAAAHHNPQKVLLLGSGAGGMLEELLQHPVKEVVYVELDPRLLEVIRLFPTDLTEKELDDSRVRLVHQDGRHYLSQTSEQFDMILLGFLTPDTLQSNRLFTVDFFSLARERLAEEGILALSLPGSAVYMGPEAADLNASLYRSLQKSVDHVEVIAGDPNIYLASEKSFRFDSTILAERLQERNITGDTALPAYLDYRLDDERRVKLIEAVQRSSAEVNYDFKPRGFLYALSYWGAIYSPGEGSIVTVLEKLHLGCYLLPLFLLPLLLIIVARKRFDPDAPTLVYAIGTSGIAGMSFGLLLLFLFQSLFGWVYQMAGLLVAAYMGGSFLGGVQGLRWTIGRNPRNIFRLLDLAVIVLFPALYGLAVLMQAAAGRVEDNLLFSVFIVFSIISGAAVGAQFPLAAAIQAKPSKKTGTVAAAIYSADLLGGWFGGLMITLVLFPLLGLGQTLLLIGLLKAGSSALLWSKKKPQCISALSESSGEF